MARRTKIDDDSSDDDLPDLDTILARKGPPREKGAASLQMNAGVKPTLTRTPSNTIRRRKLGQPAARTLSQPWTQEGPRVSTKLEDVDLNTGDESQGPRVKLRARKTQPVVEITPKEEDDDDEDDGHDDFMSAKEEITFVEEATVHEDDEELSEFHDSDSDFDVSDGDSDTEVFFDSIPTNRRPAPRERKTSPPLAGVSGSGTQTLFDDDASKREKRRREPPAKVPLQESQPDKAAVSRQKKQEPTRVPKQALEDELSKTFSRLNVDSTEDLDPPKAKTRPRPAAKSREETPTLTPPKKRSEGLISPKKFSRIPETPHQPASDMFWSQEFVNDWNDQHSPKKILFPDAGKSPAKAASPKKPSAKGATAAAREAKKAFGKDKHAIAEEFLRELDRVITNGELSRLAATTGGIKLNWTNKLNTTAGRANWKRETVRTRAGDGTTVTVTHRHHASIELAEKVIDDEDRLLNVVAHEFCHLANFMINGVTNNPHGKEFKSWAARCSRTFASRGIHVTTKHSYDIDFKYVWECAECGTAFKRHSKSINPERHRCGCCKGLLVQTKPVPRATAGKTTEYQKFMKEQMRVLKEQNPKSPQKEIMKLVADQWSRQPKAQTKGATAKGQADKRLDSVVDGLVGLTLES